MKVLKLVSKIITHIGEKTSSPTNTNYDFSDLAGKLSWQGDAVETQRKLRDEW
ncbi:MAG: hypothetical protein AAGE84_00675 [Cyanobacteria bacterium P01_G01_bin.39]